MPIALLVGGHPHSILSPGNQSAGNQSALASWAMLPVYGAMPHQESVPWAAKLCRMRWKRLTELVLVQATKHFSLASSKSVGAVVAIKGKAAKGAPCQPEPKG